MKRVLWLSELINMWTASVDDTLERLTEHLATISKDNAELLNWVVILDSITE